MGSSIYLGNEPISKVMVISTSGNLPSLTSPAQASDVRSGKEYLDGSGVKKTGTMANVSAPVPEVTISSVTGLITATNTNSAGYQPYTGATTSTLQLSTANGQTVTPGTTNQTVVAAGKYTLGAQIVEGSANLVAANIKNGTSIFGVTGTFTKEATNAATASDILSSKVAYVNGSKLTGTMPSATAPTPSISVDADAGVITASVSNPKGYQSSASTKSATQNITHTNLVAANIKSGVSIFGITGTYVGSGGGSSATSATVQIMNPGNKALLYYIPNATKTMVSENIAMGATTITVPASQVFAIKAADGSSGQAYANSGVDVKVLGNVSLVIPFSTNASIVWA